MHTWDPGKFRAALARLRSAADLSDTEIARMAGKSRSQVNRWSRAENQPGYDGLRRLATALAAEGHPEHVLRYAHELVQAAGYIVGPAEPGEEQTEAAPGRLHLTVTVNPDDPEPDYPPGGLRDTVERIIWALDEPWQARLAQIQVRRKALDTLNHPEGTAESSG